MNLKRIFALFLGLCLLLCACALAPDDASRETMGYMDSLDRGVTVPGNARRIAVTGPLSQVYLTPESPYGWLSSPPAVQRYLGMLWLGQLLYPEYAEYDLQEKVTEYYQVFYGCELTEEMYQNLIADAMP